MKIMTKPILRHIAKLACCLILLYIVFTPNISMVEQTTQEDEVPFEVYFIKSVSASLPSDMSYVESGVFMGWKNMNLLDLAKNSLTAADYFEELIELTEDTMSKYDVGDLTPAQRSNYEDLRTLKGEYSMAKFACYVIGYGAYVIVALFGLLLVGRIIDICGCLWGNEKEKQQLNEKTGSGLSVGFMTFLWLIAAQVFIVGPVNRMILISEYGFIYRLVFSGGMHCLIPTIAAIIIYFIVNIVIDRMIAE